MSAKQLSIKDRILVAALPAVAFDGWTREGLAQAAAQTGYSRDMAVAVFPDGIGDALDHFADYADRGMMRILARVPPENLRVRDRIRTAVLARLEVLGPWREAERAALGWWSMPSRHIRGGKILWRTADRIWTWAGDTAKDYNRYTKRALLSGVLAATTVAWLGNGRDDDAAIEAFLDRRIENVLRWGRVAGKFRKTG